jgi:hypothetical protein
MSGKWNNVIGRDVKQALQDIAATEKQAAEAKQIAQVAETKADEAVQVAQTAETKADSVQTQLDVIVVEGDSSVEAAQARVNAQNFEFPTLKARLDDSDTRIATVSDDVEATNDALDKSTSFFNAIWHPPTMPDTILGQGVPNTTNPNDQLAFLLDPLLTEDPDYVSKTSLGLDESGTWDIWRYDFTPANYEKTMIVSSCIHGNEYTGFFALAQFLGLLVRDWRDHPHLSYLRKNVRVITVPIANPWGFNESNRRNVNGVDLNRNFPYNWDGYSGSDKGAAPLSETEAQALDGVYSQFKDAVAYLDLHTIVSVEAEYVMFVPRYLKQDNSRFAWVVQNMHNPATDRIAWGTSVLPAATNYAGNTYGFNVGLPEFYNGLFGMQNRDSAEMTQAVKWFGNLILQSGMMAAKGTIETLKGPTMRWFVYDRSPGSLFGMDGDYEGTAGEQVPVNSVNHATSSTRTYSSDYARFGSTSLKMTANNQIVNARGDYPELVTGTYWLWLLYRRVTDMQDGHFGMNVYNINTFNNLELVTENQSATDPDWVRVGGVFQGRSGGCRLVYGRTVAWTGTVYVDGNMLVKLSGKEYNDYLEGKITLQQLMDKYDFQYEKSPPAITVSSVNYSTVTQMERRFNVATAGMVTVDGYLTFTLSTTAEVGIIPLVYQPFAPDFGWGDQNNNPINEIRRTFPAGTHTIPLHGQMYAVPTSKGISDRSGELTIRLRAKRSTGTLTIENYRVRLTFLPANPGFEIYDASKRESQNASAMTKVYPAANPQGSE